jgi:hypothetical protein
MNGFLECLYNNKYVMSGSECGEEVTVVNQISKRAISIKAEYRFFSLTQLVEQTDWLVATETNEAERCRLLSSWTQKAEELLFIRLSHAFDFDDVLTVLVSVVAPLEKNLAPVDRRENCTTRSVANSY